MRYFYILKFFRLTLETCFREKKFRCAIGDALRQVRTLYSSDTVT
jgi:hypothetical protein